MTLLQRLGFTPILRAHFELLEPGPTLTPARVRAASRGIYEILGSEATHAELSGRLRHELRPSERPKTGDWVVVEAQHDGVAIIHHILERQTVLTRRGVGSPEPQVIAANVDTFFIVTSANHDFSTRRLERYLAAVWDSGATPVIVLNKIDLCEDVRDFVTEIEGVAFGVDIIPLSAKTGESVETLRQAIGEKTCAFIGSSGVGKSSLVNRLRNVADQHTLETRSGDDKGRHTTTRRELLLLDGGGVLIDTPGMREFGVMADEDALDATFQDVAEVAERCRFSDCQHNGEPGCAVSDAIDAGVLSDSRMASYQKLRKEAAAARRRADPVAGANTKRHWKSINKAMRKLSKESDKHRVD